MRFGFYLTRYLLLSPWSRQFAAVNKKIISGYVLPFYSNSGAILNFNTYAPLYSHRYDWSTFQLRPYRRFFKPNKTANAPRTANILMLQHPVWRFLMRRRTVTDRQHGRGRLTPRFGFFFRRSLRNSTLSIPRLKTPNSSIPLIKLTSTDMRRFTFFTDRKDIQFSFFSKTLPFYAETRNRTLNSYLTNWIYVFRSATSRFLRIDTKQVLISYNLMGLRTTKNWLTRFSNADLLQKPLYLVGSLRSHLYRLRNRRVRVFWVSKITQRTLTPSRREFNTLSEQKKLRYQRRLTRLISNYYRWRVFEYINNMEWRLEYILLRSGLAHTPEMLRLLLQTRLLFLNNFPLKTAHRHILLAPLDTIQLVPSCEYLLFLKWNSAHNFINNSRFFFYLKKWRTRRSRPYPKMSSYRIPEWVRRYVFRREPVSSNFEMDLTTLTLINLNTQNKFLPNYHYLSINYYPTATTRGLNWKSLT